MARTSRKISSETIQNPLSLHVYSAAVYVRLSVEDTRKKISDSIGTQKTMLLNYLQMSADLQLYNVYEDVNCTGTNFNRPGFSHMMDDIQAGLVDCVIVKDLSRFGRSFEETGHYLERVFPFLQVRFISVVDNYDSLTASLDESNLIIPLKNLMNEVYARDISKKVKSSKRIKQQRGEFCGPIAPYGYSKIGTSLVIDEETAPVVQMIFNWALDGMSDTKIVQKLNDLKILPPSRYRFENGITKAKKHEKTLFWYTSAVNRMLANPVYTGTIASGKYHTLSIRGRLVEKNKNEWLIFEDAHPAVIGRDTFESVQKILQARKQNNKTVPIGSIQKNIYKGLIFCGDCGKYMGRMKAKKKYVYVCSVYTWVDRNSCTRKPIREADLQNALFDHIRNDIKLAANLEAIISKLMKSTSHQARQNAITKQIENIRIKLRQNQQFRGSLWEDYQDGVLSEQDYRQMRMDYDEENKYLQNEYETLLSEKQKQEIIISPNNKWIEAFRRFENERQLTSEIVSALIERIDVYDGAKIEVVLKYRDELEALQNYITHCTHDNETRAANG